MDSTDLARIQRRVRLHYESARAQRALFGFAPVLVLVAAAVILGRRPSLTVAFGLGLFVLGAVLLWYGRDLKRAVLPGLAAGLVPLTLVLCAMHLAHACTGDGCMTLCVPACVAGGLVAGLAVGVVGRRGRHGAGFWLATSAVALLTGAMGCICVGYAGLAGLLVGYGAGLVPVAVQALFTRKSS